MASSIALDQTKAHSIDRWVGLVHDVVVYEDVEPMAVGGNHEKRTIVGDSPVGLTQKPE